MIVKPPGWAHLAKGIVPKLVNKQNLNEEMAMDSKQIQQQIESLIPKAETGEQWAAICLLETLMVAAVCKEEGVPFEIRGAAE